LPPVTSTASWPASRRPTSASSASRSSRPRSSPCSLARSTARRPEMNALAAEFSKLKRSLSWAVVVLLPIVLVVTGSIMALSGGRGMQDGGHTLWRRSVVFYGLFPRPVAIAILAALVWRAEHRGSNWNALMAGPTPSLLIVFAKAAVISVLAAIMQAIAVVTAVVLGKIGFGLPGSLPPEYLAVSLVIILAGVPVAV